MMLDLKTAVNKIANDNIKRIIISNTASKAEQYKKILIERKNTNFHISKYTDKQVFHENILPNELETTVFLLTNKHFKQINAWSEGTEHIILISKSGSCTYKHKESSTCDHDCNSEHNRKKNYILQENTVIAPLVDMGIFSPDGKIIKQMYSKFKQINRFLEIIDDEISKCETPKLHIIDFGCGKSYLTFVLYYYLTEIKKIDTEIIGLDLKAEVIDKCNKAAARYGYNGIRFELGDINGYNAPFKPDMVISLHACDTATDFALYNAMQWGAKYIFSVPCCQHELNSQIAPKNFSIISRYGIVQERFSALATDAIRANLLEYNGYKTQLIEFIDFEHTPKNILIRAAKRNATSEKTKDAVIAEIEKIIDEFGFQPTLYKLLQNKSAITG